MDDIMAEPVTTVKPFSLDGVKGFISHAYKSRFVRNVAVVASGTAGAQAITMAFAPIITRLYGPEAFGKQLGAKRLGVCEPHRGWLKTARSA